MARSSPALQGPYCFHNSSLFLHFWVKISFLPYTQKFTKICALLVPEENGILGIVNPKVMTSQQPEPSKQSMEPKCQHSRTKSKHKCWGCPTEDLTLLWDGHRTYMLVANLWQNVKFGKFHIRKEKQLLFKQSLQEFANTTSLSLQPH